MNVPQEIKDRVKKEVEFCWKTSEGKYSNFNLTFPQIWYKKRGQTAGEANITQNILNFNPTLLMNNLENGFIKQTVRHECAHLIADHIFKQRCNHGGLWKKVMHDLGVPSHRTHNYNIDHLQPYVWHCACSEHRMTKRLHNSMMKGKYRICKKCKGRLSIGPIMKIDIKKAALKPEPKKYKPSTSRIDWNGTSFRKDGICKPVKKESTLWWIVQSCDGTQTIDQLFNDVNKAKKQIRTLARRGYAIELKNGKIKIY